MLKLAGDLEGKLSVMSGLSGSSIRAAAVGLTASAVVYWAFQLLVKPRLLRKALAVAYKGTDKFALAILKYLGPKRCPIWFYQKMLPPLPLPKVEDSVKQWLRSIEPLVDEVQRAEAEAAAQQFLQSNPGELQALLAGLAKKSPNQNWLESLWLEFAYLRGRDPLPTNVNFYCTESSENLFKPPHETDPCRRLAQIIVAAVDFKLRVDRGTYDCLRVGGVVPVCMDGFSQVLGTTRIPGRTVDRLRTHPAREDAHVLLIVGGEMFKLPVLIGGRRVAVDKVEAAIRSAQQAARGSEAAPMPLLTSRRRDLWAENREALIAGSALNADAMEIVEQALFGATMMDCPSGCPDDIHTYSRQALHGDGRSIWFDKCFTVLAYPDGRLGWHFEHTYADAPVPGLLCEYVLIYSNPTATPYRKYPLLKDPYFAGDDKLTRAEPIRWDLTGLPKFPSWIDDAGNEFKELISNVDLCPTYFMEYGAQLVKKLKLSPDGYVQAALQVAAIQYFGSPVLTYESASLRSFRGGRTETIRSATSEAVAFAKALLALPKDATKEQMAAVAEALRTSTTVHVKVARAASQGAGCDRHLLGLRIASAMMGRSDPIFSTRAYGLQYLLSTSQTPIVQEHGKEVPPELMTRGGGFGPVTDPGIGASYFILEDRMYFNISARCGGKGDPNEATKRFGGLVVDALRRMRAIMEAAPAPAAPAKRR